MTITELMNTLDAIILLANPADQWPAFTICQSCTAPVLRHRSTKKYCSNACRQKAYRRRKE